MCAAAALGYLSPLYDLMFAMQDRAATGDSLGGGPAGFVDGVVSGQTICGIGLTEPGAGSDVSQIATRAVRSDDGSYVIDGDKVFISMPGGDALWCCTRAPMLIRKGPDRVPSANGYSGVTVEPMQLLCDDDHVIGRVLLRSVRLPDSARLGTEGQGMTLAMQTLKSPSDRWCGGGGDGAAGV